MKTILLVEDNPVIVLAYRRHLESAGFRVEVANDGLAAMKVLRSLKPDLVLLDIMMPRVDGTVVLKYIRSEPELKKIPVIVLSEVSNVDLTKEAVTLKPEHVFVKSHTTPKQLEAAILELLDGSGSSQP